MSIQQELRILWDALDTTINPITTSEGEQMDNGQIRYVHHNVWLYVDDSAGFQLMTDEEAATLGNDLEP